MIAITATMTTHNAELKDDTLQAMVKYFDGAHVEFEKAALKVHRKTVFEILITLIRFTPVLTGRLRGSWTPYLDRFGKQSSYARYLNDKSLVRNRPTSALAKGAAAIKKVLGIDEVSQGKSQGFFMDSGLVTTVGSNVEYAAKINAQSHYLDRATEDANRIINANFEQFLKAAREAGWIPTDFSDEPKPEN
jgi:hypothetical protein